MPSIDQNMNSINSNIGLNDNSPTIVSILHFNDCYNVEPRSIEPSGGAARMVSFFNSYRQCDPLVLFSGDIMAPSMMSTFTKGQQMIAVLNRLAVDCALFGNHEFDFGIEELKKFVSKTTFPWLMSNVFDPQTDRPLGNAGVWHIVQRKGKKIGIIGLVEEQWLADAIDVPFNYRNFVSEGKRLAKHLKEKERVDLVIALTHMRWPNDTLLAQNVAEIDLILGGHDHDYQIRKINNKFCIKSGTDFRQFSKIDIEFSETEKFVIKCKEITVNSFDFPEDETLKQEIEKYSSVVESKMDLILGRIGVDIDGTFATIRNRETNLGNFVCDIILATTGADVVILNSGTFRSDQIHPKGDFKVRDLVRILPMMDAMVMLNVTGYQLWQTLECGLARWPVLDGSFPQVSRIKFSFDPRKPVGTRIDPNCVLIGDKCLDLEKNYRLMTKEFLHKGKDGYYVLKESDVLLSEEQCLDTFTSVKNYFESVAKLGADSDNDINSNRLTLVPNSGSNEPMSDILALEYELRKFEPKVEGRITCLID